jgi:hypothetical protein
VIRVLPDDGAVSAKTCRRHLVKRYKYSNVYVHLVGKLKIQLLYENVRHGKIHN